MKDLTLDTTLKALVLMSTSDFGITSNSTYVLCLLLCTRPHTHVPSRVVSLWGLSASQDHGGQHHLLQLSPSQE